ncbi:hypothetical protein SLEP1_g32066 [Rubroshorea leprosula]|uniref:Uncharacterized protein n=1 Tax=Rubroshorea leprosula TaxID=152421 RepID=A0AAV5KCA0_9ROSI|nr:hypothetical protein SLEP1_g32066 [Rubroshorea leprosula]
MVKKKEKISEVSSSPPPSSVPSFCRLCLDREFVPLSLCSSSAYQCSVIGVTIVLEPPLLMKFLKSSWVDLNWMLK